MKDVASREEPRKSEPTGKHRSICFPLTEGCNEHLKTSYPPINQRNLEVVQLLSARRYILILNRSVFLLNFWHEIFLL